MEARSALLPAVLPHAGARAAARFAALVVVAVIAAGCVAPGGTSPGPDNPQLVLYHTEDGATQMVVKGAFKEREYDRIRVFVDDALVEDVNHTYLVGHKVNRTSFNLSLRVALAEDTYAYEAALVVAPAPNGNAMQVTVAEIVGGSPATPETKGFPVTRILEKEPEEKA